MAGDHGAGRSWPRYADPLGYHHHQNQKTQTMKNKELGYLLIGAAAFMLLQRRNTPANYAPQFAAAPPMPQVNTAQAWQNWINSIVNLYGNVRALWQPGGPFYNAQATGALPATNDIYLPPNPFDGPELPAGSWA